MTGATAAFLFCCVLACFLACSGRWRLFPCYHASHSSGHTSRVGTCSVSVSRPDLGRVRLQASRDFHHPTRNLGLLVEGNGPHLRSFLPCSDRLGTLRLLGTVRLQLKLRGCMPAVGGWSVRSRPMDFQAMPKKYQAMTAFVQRCRFDFAALVDTARALRRKLSKSTNCSQETSHPRHGRVIEPGTPHVLTQHRTRLSSSGHALVKTVFIIGGATLRCCYEVQTVVPHHGPIDPALRAKALRIGVESKTYYGKARRPSRVCCALSPRPRGKQAGLSRRDTDIAALGGKANPRGHASRSEEGIQKPGFSRGNINPKSLHHDVVWSSASQFSCSDRGLMTRSGIRQRWTTTRALVM